LREFKSNARDSCIEVINEKQSLVLAECQGQIYRASSIVGESGFERARQSDTKGRIAQDMLDLSVDTATAVRGKLHSSIFINSVFNTHCNVLLNALLLRIGILLGCFSETVSLQTNGSRLVQLLLEEQIEMLTLFFCGYSSKGIVLGILQSNVVIRTALSGRTLVLTFKPAVKKSMPPIVDS